MLAVQNRKYAAVGRQQFFKLEVLGARCHFWDFTVNSWFFIVDWYVFYVHFILQKNSSDLLFVNNLCNLKFVFDMLPCYCKSVANLCCIFYANCKCEIKCNFLMVFLYKLSQLDGLHLEEAWRCL
jgi:hypothetical protein